MKKNVKIIRCENSGKSKTFKGNCAKNFEKNKFEFMSQGPPYQNGVLERGFVTLYSRMHVMMSHSVIHENPNTFLWPKCAATATKLENIMVNMHG